MKKFLLFMVCHFAAAADSELSEIWFQQISGANSLQQLERRINEFTQLEIEQKACEKEVEQGFIPKSCFLLENLRLVKFSTSREKYFKNKSRWERQCLQVLPRYRDFELLKYHFKDLDTKTRCYIETERKLQRMAYKNEFWFK